MAKHREYVVVLARSERQLQDVKVRAADPEAAARGALYRHGDDWYGNEMGPVSVSRVETKGPPRPLRPADPVVMLPPMMEEVLCDLGESSEQAVELGRWSTGAMLEELSRRDFLLGAALRSKQGRPMTASDLGMEGGDALL